MPPSSHGLPTEETDVSRLGRYEINGETAQLLDSKVIYDSKLTWGVALGTYCDRSSGQLENIYWQSAVLAAFSIFAGKSRAPGKTDIFPTIAMSSILSGRIGSIVFLVVKTIAATAK
jgi:hypothetical protein